MGLLMYYLLEHRGMRAPVVSTINETAMVARLGERYGVPVHETPVGFKYVGPKMIETGAMMGGEESGGYGFGMHLPERDGIYADLLLLDLDTPELLLAPFDAALVYSATGSVVDTAVVDGHVLMRGRHIDGEEEVRARAREAAAVVRGEH